MIHRRRHLSRKVLKVIAETLAGETPETDAPGEAT